MLICKLTEIVSSSRSRLRLRNSRSSFTGKVITLKLDARWTAAFYGNLNEIVTPAGWQLRSKLKYISAAEKTFHCLSDTWCMLSRIIYFQVFSSFLSRRNLVFGTKQCKHKSTSDFRSTWCHRDNGSLSIAVRKGNKILMMNVQRLRFNL